MKRTAYNSNVVKNKAELGRTKGKCLRDLQGDVLTLCDHFVSIKLGLNDNYVEENRRETYNNSFQDLISDGRQYTFSIVEADI